MFAWYYNSSSPTCLIGLSIFFIRTDDTVELLTVMLNLILPETWSVLLIFASFGGGVFSLTPTIAKQFAVACF